MGNVTLTIKVEAIGEIESDSDADVPGTYEASVPQEAYDRSKEDACDMALDAFHGKVCIETLDDFKIDVTGPDGAKLVGNETWEPVPGVRAIFDGRVA